MRPRRRGQPVAANARRRSGRERTANADRGGQGEPASGESLAMSTVTKPITYDYPRTPLKGKAVVISGGTTGIGRATAVALASQGANVLIFGRNQEHLDDALEDLRAVSNGSQVHGVIADQARKEEVQKVFEEAM